MAVVVFGLSALPSAGNAQSIDNGNLVGRLYIGVLGRDADLNGWDYWTNKLNSSQSNAQQVASAFTGSTEFTGFEGAFVTNQGYGCGLPVNYDGSNSPSSNNSLIVSVLYRTALGRCSDPGGQTYWEGILNGGTSAGVVALDFVSSSEFGSDQTYIPPSYSSKSNQTNQQRVQSAVQSYASASGNCYTLTYGGVNGSATDVGAYIGYGSPIPTRLNGNEVFMTSYTSVSGPNSQLIITNAKTTAFLNGATLAYNSQTSNAYGGTINANTTQLLFANNQFHLGTFQLGSPGNPNDHFGTSPVCSSQLYPLSPNHYSDYSSSITTVKPTVVGVNSASSASIWYLGGAPSIDGFYVQTSLYGTAHWGASPALHWSVTQRPDKVSLDASIANQVIVTSAGASASSTSGVYDYDVWVQADTDGLPSDPFKISVNAPWSVYGQYEGTSPYGPQQQGYTSQFRLQVFDVAGLAISAPITLHETLENCQVDYPSASWCGPPSIAGTWYATPPPGEVGWDSAVPGTWVDYYYVYGAAGFYPAPLSQTDPPGPLGMTAVVNRTQKWFVGTAGASNGANVFSGACVETNKIQSFLDHGERQKSSSPVPPSQCVSGAFVNP